MRYYSRVIVATLGTAIVAGTLFAQESGSVTLLYSNVANHGYVEAGFGDREPCVESIDGVQASCTPVEYGKYTGQKHGTNRYQLTPGHHVVTLEADTFAIGRVEFDAVSGATYRLIQPARNVVEVIGEQKVVRFANRTATVVEEGTWRPVSARRAEFTPLWSDKRTLRLYEGPELPSSETAVLFVNAALLSVEGRSGSTTILYRAVDSHTTSIDKSKKFEYSVARAPIFAWVHGPEALLLLPGTYTVEAETDREKGWSRTDLGVLRAKVEFRAEAGRRYELSAWKVTIAFIQSREISKWSAGVRELPAGQTEVKRARDMP